MIDVYRILDRRHEHRILASMLLVLHAALDAGLDSALAAALMTTHLGLFFLWQPIWQTDQRLQLKTAVTIAALVALMLATLNWWSIFVWLVLLIGIVAGRSFSTRHERYVYMLSLAFLVCELLINCVAMVFFAHPLSGAIADVFRYGLYLLPLVLLAIPAITAPQRDPFAVDFFRGITFALMTALMAVSSVLMTYHLEVDYPLALVVTLIALGAFLLFLSWLATPGSGDIGLLAVWEKSVLNIGTPFEAWLGNIANLAAQRNSADEFLEAAAEELNDIPWVAGVAWHTETANGQEGHESLFDLTIEAHPLSVTLYTERHFSPALIIHCRLLIQVLSHFYVAKQRENKEANEAHLRAIYATGARVTHDIKNLLQSLNTMAESMPAVTSPEQQQRGFELMQRRLPDIANRLRLALEKLQRPASRDGPWLAATQWWAGVEQRFGETDITLSLVNDASSCEIPPECFDSIVDNLIENARNKIAAGEASAIEVSLTIEHHHARVDVIDNGTAIDNALVRQLFAEPVASAVGHGIGLFQAARQAELNHCELLLSENREGVVCFSLRGGRA